MDGSAEFTQSFFTGSNAKYTIWVRGDGIKAGDNIEVGLDDDCEGETNVATSDGADYMVSMSETGCLLMFLILFILSDCPK